MTDGNDETVLMGRRALLASGLALGAAASLPAYAAGPSAGESGLLRESGIPADIVLYNGVLAPIGLGYFLYSEVRARRVVAEVTIDRRRELRHVRDDALALELDDRREQSKYASRQTGGTNMSAAAGPLAMIFGTNTALLTKRFELLRQLLPNVRLVGFLVNPNGAGVASAATLAITVSASAPIPPPPISAAARGTPLPASLPGVVPP